jgi:hypothetical protein
VGLVVLNVMTTKLTIILLLLIVIGGLTACERRLTVMMDGKVPPAFTFDGNGDIQRVFIYQVTKDGKVPPKGSEFWVIVPTNTVVASRCPPIIYGVVPDGFVQRIPQTGAPPKLEEGQTYGFGAVTTEAPGGDMWFTIQAGKSIRAKKTDPADPE